MKLLRKASVFSQINSKNADFFLNAVPNALTKYSIYGIF